MESVQRIWTTPVWARPVSEEAANYLTHGAGLAMSIAGLWQLLAATAGRGAVGQVAGVALFGGSMVVLYLASTLYHAVERAALKRQLRVCDHAAIYLMIAGSYTPFLLALPDPWPTWGLGAVWLLALAGICFKLILGVAYERLSIVMYLAIGWLGVLTIEPLIEHISARGVAWVIAGGLAYTMGTFFYIRHDTKYAHAVWHLFVLLGTAFHYGAVVLYVVPLTFAG